MSLSRKIVLLLLSISTQISAAAEAGQAQGDRKLTVQQVQELPVPAKRFALVIGVDAYEDSQINKLEGASNDAKEIVEALVQYAGFPRDLVSLLTADQPAERRPTRNKIFRQLSILLRVVPKDGLLLIAFVGHGIERGAQAYLLPSDAELSNDNDVSLLEQSSINVDDMRKRIVESEVGQVLLILDAWRNDPSAGRGDADNKLTNSFTQHFSFEERNSEVKAFATLYATDVGSRAYEYKEKKQGYFSWAFVEGLKGAAANERGKVTLGALVRYVQEFVSGRVLLDLGATQKPLAVLAGYKVDELVIAGVADPIGRAKGLKESGRYYALVIGNNDYRYVRRLVTAINDARVIESVLRETYGFETRLLLNAGRDQVLTALNEYRRALQENASLIIYYAGHGYYDRDVDKAYWIPIDARPDNNVNWISADDITTNIKGIPARHILLVSDSCYSGMIPRESRISLTTPRERERYLQKMIDGKSRILMSSGGNEPVADGGGSGHSVFAAALLKGLKQMDVDVFTSEELFYQYVREPVAGRADQAPQYNPIRNSGHDSGDFVFFRKGSVPR